MNILKLLNDKEEKGFKRPYIIAEAGVNHEGSMDTAKRLIDEANEGGADAIKFQTYKAETIASKDSPAYWDTSKEPTLSQYKLFKKHDSFWKKEFIELKEYCDKADIEFLSTPFDFEAADFLDDLMPVFKISSSDITNKPFIEFICEKRKPVILSTGASYLHEIEEAVSWMKPYSIEYALLHCVLNYPTHDSNANLGMIPGLKKKFSDTLIGYSDHTLPKDMKTLEVAYLLGAQILEKHFTHDKTLPGNDHYHAMDFKDLKKLIVSLERTYKLTGETEKRSLESEKISRENARRSLVSVRKLKRGDKVLHKDLTFKRPAHGISPKYIEKVVGMVLTTDIDEDVPFEWYMVK
jgi:N-acetylneuraminate synthase